MKNSNGHEKLFGRLAKFSVKNPPESLEWGYTEQIMEKIRGICPQPVFSWKKWLQTDWVQTSVRTGLTLATVTAGLFLLFLVNRPHPAPPSEQEALMEVSLLEDYSPSSAEDLLDQLKQIDEIALSIS